MACQVEEDLLGEHYPSEKVLVDHIGRVEEGVTDQTEYSVTIVDNEERGEKALNSHPCQDSNLVLVMMALHQDRSFADDLHAGVDDEAAAAAEASYAEILAVFVACEVDAHAAVEVYTVDT